MISIGRRTLAALVFAAFLLTACSVLAQISGTVTDSTGAALEEAVVQAWDSYPAGSIVAMDTTDASGAYSLSVAAGTYDVRVYHDVIIVVPENTYYITEVTEDVSAPSSGINFALDMVSVIQTNESVGFWSINTTLWGQAVQVGDVVMAEDPDSVSCGGYVISTEGSYGILPVYRDDGTTGGAQPGDTLSFYINGFPARPLGPDDPIWTSNGDLWQVNLEVVETPPPVAEFVGIPTSGTRPLAVQFTDQSTGVIASWSWDFGDGGTSSVQNPSHPYTAVGTYTVSLTVSGPGGTDTETKADYITVVEAPPVAAFAGIPTSGTRPLAVQFTDQSTGVIASWSWDFGDGGTSSVQNPSHPYTAVGTYTVSLTVSGPGGTDTETKADYITVREASPVAAFAGSPTSGNRPLVVQFTDESTGVIASWSWDFGDGGTSTEQHPSHTYTAVGTYTVSLTVSGPGGTDTETKADYITVIEAPPVDRILLDRRWNLISFTPDPDSAAVDSVLNSIAGNYSVVMGEYGSYVVADSLKIFNTLDSVDMGKGYWIQLVDTTAVDTLTIVGTPTSVDTALHLHSGWNLVGYMPETTQEVTAALLSIDGNYAVVMGAEGTFIPGGPPAYNTLDSLVNGRGYWIKMDVADILRYSEPAPASKLAAGLAKVASPKVRASEVAMTPFWGEFFGEATVDGHEVQVGDVVTVLDLEDVKCGTFVVTTPGKFGYLRVYGDDMTTPDVDEGAVPGDAIRFFINGRSASIGGGDAPIWIGEREIRNVNLIVGTVTDAADHASPVKSERFSLSQNYPNPFNLSSNIDYALSEDAWVELSIHDTNGQLVRTLVNEEKEAGFYTVRWDGRDHQDMEVASGVYLYRIIAGSYADSRKMVLLR